MSGSGIHCLTKCPAVAEPRWLLLCNALSFQAKLRHRGPLTCDGVIEIKLRSSLFP